LPKELGKSFGKQLFLAMFAKFRTTCHPQWKLTERQNAGITNDYAAQAYFGLSHTTSTDIPLSRSNMHNAVM